MYKQQTSLHTGATTSIKTLPRGYKYKQIPGEVPQRSVLGPTLWNILYDGILRIKLPEGAPTLTYANDLALVLTAKTEDKLMEAENKSLTRIWQWLRSKKLQISSEKSKTVLVIGKKKAQTDLLCRRKGSGMTETKWIGTLKFAKYQNLLNRIQRKMNLKIC